MRKSPPHSPNPNRGRRPPELHPARDTPPPHTTRPCPQRAAFFLSWCRSPSLDRRADVDPRFFLDFFPPHVASSNHGCGFLFLFLVPMPGGRVFRYAPLALFRAFPPPLAAFGASPLQCFFHFFPFEFFSFPNGGKGAFVFSVVEYVRFRTPPHPSPPILGLSCLGIVMATYDPLSSLFLQSLEWHPFFSCWGFRHVGANLDAHAALESALREAVAFFLSSRASPACPSCPAVVGPFFFDESAPAR